MNTETQYTITPESMARELARLREKARHGEAQALHHARQESHTEGMSQRSVEIARNLLKIGLPPAQITEATGLTLEEIKELGSQP